MSQLSVTQFSGLVLPIGQLPQQQSAPLPFSQVAAWAGNNLTANNSQPRVIFFRDPGGQVWATVGNIHATSTAAPIPRGGMNGFVRLHLNNRITDPAVFRELIATQAAALGLDPANVQIFNGTDLRMIGDGRRWAGPAVSEIAHHHQPATGGPRVAVRVSAILQLANLELPAPAGPAVNATNIGTALRYTVTGLNSPEAVIHYGPAGGMGTPPMNFRITIPANLRTAGVTGVNNVELRPAQRIILDGRPVTVVPIRVTWDLNTGGTRTSQDHECFFTVNTDGMITGGRFMGSTIPAPRVTTAIQLSSTVNLRGDYAAASGGTPRYSPVMLRFGPGADDLFPLPNNTHGHAASVQTVGQPVQSGLNRRHNFLVRYVNSAGQQQFVNGHVLQGADGSVASVAMGTQSWNRTEMSAALTQARAQVPADVEQFLVMNARMAANDGGPVHGQWRAIGTWADIQGTLQSGNLNLAASTPMFMSVHANGRVSLGWYPTPANNTTMREIISNSYTENPVERIGRQPVRGWYLAGTLSERTGTWTQPPQPGGAFYTSIAAGPLRQTSHQGGSSNPGAVSSIAIQFGPTANERLLLRNSGDTHVGPIQWVGNFRRITAPGTGGAPTQRLVFTVASSRTGGGTGLVYEEGYFTLSNSGAPTGAVFRGRSYNQDQLTGAPQANPPGAALPPAFNHAAIVSTCVHNRISPSPTRAGISLVFPGTTPQAVTIIPPPGAQSLVSVNNFRPVWRNGSMVLAFTATSRREMRTDSWDYGNFITEEGHIELTGDPPAASAVVLHRNGVDRRLPLGPNLQTTLALDSTRPLYVADAFRNSHLAPWYTHAATVAAAPDGFRPVDLYPVHLGTGTLSLTVAADSPPDLRTPGATFAYRILNNGAVVLRLRHPQPPNGTRPADNFLISRLTTSDLPSWGGVYSGWTAARPDGTGGYESAIPPLFASSGYTEVLPRPRP